METRRLYSVPKNSAPLSASAPNQGDQIVSAVSGGKINILLAGGSRLLQEGVIQLLDNSQFSVVTCVDKLEHAIQRISQKPGTFQMMIVQLEDMNDAQFFEQLAQAKRVSGNLRIVLLSWPTKALSFLAQSFQSGIDAYLESNTSQEGFRQSLGLVAAGERVFPDRLTPDIRSGGVAAANEDAAIAADSRQSPLFSNLSGREFEILRHLASGRPNKVIANDLNITEATVKVHVKGVLRKIGAANRTQAAIWALHNGLKPIGGGEESTAY
jgi:two-component system, NarL family, nitrate/nitrite response regulator NarL